MTWIMGRAGGFDAILWAMRDIYRFEEIDENLDLVPLAGRRALDAAGAKVGLAAWRALPLPARRAIVAAGGADRVDAAAVRAQLSGVEHTAIEAAPEPDPISIPDAVSAYLSEKRDGRWWASLRGLDRWALDSLARRGRREPFDRLLLELG